MSKIKLLIADDHPIFLNGFCSAIELQYPEFKIIGAVSNGRAAVEKAEELKPDVVLLDVRMPVMGGVEAATRIKARYPDVKIVMLTTFDEKELIADALKAGAMGYILKEMPIAEVVMGIRSVYQGNMLIAGQAAKKIDWASVSGMELGIAGDKDPTPGEDDIPTEYQAFSRRERDVFFLVVEGKNNRQIADELHISESTVRNYVSRIYDILRVHTRTGVLLWAFEHGLRR